MKQRNKNKGVLKKAEDKTLNTAIMKAMVFRGLKWRRELDRNSREAEALSVKTLKAILDENKDTEYGRKYDFAGIHSVNDYKKKVPLSTYKDYEPYIRRMVDNGEQGLILAEAPRHYAVSSGSVGVPKYIPVSQKELLKYTRYATSMVFGVAEEYIRDTTGKHLHTGYGINLIELKLRETPSGVQVGAISGALLSEVKRWVSHFLALPWDIMEPKVDMDLRYLKARFVLERRDITFVDGAFMTSLVDLADYITANWKMLCKDIWYGRINDGVRIPPVWRKRFEAMLSPNPERAKELIREFRKGEEGILPRIWKNLQFVASIGTGGFSSYTKKLRRYTGKNVPFNNLTYAASEGLFATARHMMDTSYVLIPDGGFYEFLPANADDEGKTLTIGQLEEGEDYEIIVTNLSGFYRYRIGDVVRVTGFYNEAPMLQFLYRKSQLLSIAGEKTNEEAVRWTIDQFAKETGVAVRDFSVYADIDSKPGHYVFLVEPEQGIPKERLEELRDVIDEKMMEANPSYGDKVRKGVLLPAELFIEEQQTYQLYRELMIMKGTSPNQVKPVRVIDTPAKKDFFYGLRERIF